MKNVRTTTVTDLSQIRTQINEAVHLALQECGIEIHLGYTAIDVQFSTQNDLQAVRLENKLFDSKSFTVKSVEESDKLSTSTPLHALRPQFLTLECTTLLCCVRKSCEADIFTAINESGLVYDGGVVVDEVSHRHHQTVIALSLQFLITPNRSMPQSNLISSPTEISHY